MVHRIKTQEMLDLTIAMWDDPLVYCYQNLQLAKNETNSIFLVGPSSRQDILEFKWRVFAVHYLRQAGFKGVIYVPEPREDDWSFKRMFPIPIPTWERERILSSTIVLAWLCRDETQLPGRMTNFEVGYLCGMAEANPERFGRRILVGHPPNAWKVSSEMNWAQNAGIKPFTDLAEMCHAAQSQLST